MPATHNSTVGYVLVVVLVLGIIGGVTWVTQFLPKWNAGAQGKQVSPGALATREVIQFSWPAQLKGGLVESLQPVWDPEDVGYAREVEKGTEGHCYFPFRNVLAAPAEFEMESVSCDCTHADLCLLPAVEWQKIDEAWRKASWESPAFTTEPTWIRLTKNEHSGIKIPADGQGLLRITWNARKSYGELLNLSLRFWGQPEGNMNERHFTPIRVPVRVVPPLLFHPTQVPVGVLGPGQSTTAEFDVWSATRPHPDLAFKSEGQPDPLLVVEARKLNDAECVDLQKRARENKHLTRVKCGYRVIATLMEEKDGRQMDLGPFQRTVPIRIDDAPLPYSGPVITGTVRGPVTIGGELDHGKVQFNTFSSANAKSVVVPVYAAPALKLEIADYYPPLVEVALKRNEKGSTPQRTQWDLKVTAAADAITGPFPADSRVVLRIAGAQPRLVRIPIVGTGTR